MGEYVLNVQPRAVVGKKVSQLRNAGLVPVIVYGPRMESQPFQAKYRELELALMKAGGTNLIDVVVDGGETYLALARDVQRDPIRGSIKHVDLFAVDENARVTIEVPLVLFGESAAVVTRKGLLLTGPTALRLEMKATNMRNKVEINLADYSNVGDSLYVRDLDLGADTRILNDPEEMILRVVQTSAARREEALSKAAATPAPGKKK